MFLHIKYIQYNVQRFVHYIEEGIYLVAVSPFQIARKAFIFYTLLLIIHANNHWHFELSSSF